MHAREEYSILLLNKLIERITKESLTNSKINYFMKTSVLLVVPYVNIDSVLAIKSKR